MDNNPLNPNNPNAAPEPEQLEPAAPTPQPAAQSPEVPAQNPLIDTAPSPLTPPTPAFVPTDTSNVPDTPVAPQPVTPETPGNKNTFKLIAIISAIVAIVAAVGVAAFLLLKPLTPEDVYYQALKNNVSQKSDSKVAITMDATTGSLEINAVAVGTPGAEHADASKGYVKDVEITTPYGPIKISMDLIEVRDGDSRKSYTKTTSMSSSEKMLNDQIKDYKDDKWKLETKDSSEDKNQETSSVSSLTSVLVPHLSLSSKDASIYIDEVKKAQIFKIGKEAVDATFKDQKVKEIGVTVTKDSYGKFLTEANKTLSEETKKQLNTNPDDIDKIFGDNDELSARVYIKDGTIIGFKANAQLPKYGADNESDTEDYNIVISIEYNSTLKIEAPEDSEITSSDD